MNSELNRMRPSAEELKDLSEKLRKYIFALESELESVAYRSRADSDELRRKRWAYWKR